MMKQILFAATIGFSVQISVAQETPKSHEKPASEVVSASRTDVVVVLGAEGTSEFGEQFRNWADSWKSVADKADANWNLVGGTDAGKLNDREQLKAMIESLPVTGVRPIWIVMIGHGTSSRQMAKFNLRGPDVSATDLGLWLEPIQRPLVIVNCASSSGPFINRLSGKNRVVVTATKSGAQYNFARFGKYFAQAISSLDSDLDHDDAVSVHEAFLRASSDVKEFYAAEARISTEHALIDDNGDSLGTPAKMFRGVRAIAKAKDGAKLDGGYALRLTLSPVGKQLSLTDAELEQRGELEKQLEALRSQQDEMDESEFDKAVEPIVLQLARIYQAAEKRESN